MISNLYSDYFKFIFLAKLYLMARKERKIITEEIFNIMKNMLHPKKININEIAESTGLNRKTVSNQIKRIELGLGFASAYKKINRTCQVRNETLNDMKNIILNSIDREIMQIPKLR